MTLEKKSNGCQTDLHYFIYIHIYKIARNAIENLKFLERCFALHVL